MEAIFFDGLAYAKRLEKAGVDRQQAEAQAEALQTAFGRYEEKKLGEFASKGDIQLIRSEAREMEVRLENRIENCKHEILKWVISTILAQTAIIAALIGVVIAYLPR